MKELTKGELCKVLKYTFGHDEFRPLQLDAVQATLSGRDSLLILPTGGGKSMTFQLPALAKGNCFTVVVGPLMALAKDQVDSCLDIGIDARVWNSDTSEEARKGIQSDLVSNAPEMRLLYTTPESLRHPSLREYLKEAYESGTLLSFAIDEAHCVSDWGHDFRPAYLELASLKQDFPNTPIAALTASCTPVVEGGIIQLLKLQAPVLIKGGFNRPNIQYTVLYKELINDGKQDDLVEHLVDFIKQRQGQCGIIYARLRATCDWLGSALGSCDLDVGVYHAGKDSARRRKVQQDWCEGGLDIVVATVAFGMGIDRADVRWVVHWDVPASLEGYYQESGRAGRDGQSSEAVLYVSADDLDTLTKLEKGNRSGSAAAVASFSCRGGCKRRKLIEYFGQRRSSCDAGQGEILCDYCSQPGPTRQLIQQWEAQVQRAAVAKVLREQREAAGKERSGGESDAEDSAPADAGADGSCTAVAGGAGARLGWQGGRSVASSNMQVAGRPRPGVWAPATAHDRTAAAPAGSQRKAAAPSDLCADVVHTQQDENLPPALTASPQAASGSVSCTAGALLQPQSCDQTQGLAAAATAQPKGPAGKPQLKRRQAPRGQQPWGSFKAPRMQHNSKPSSSNAVDSMDADPDPSATAGEPPDIEVLQAAHHQQLQQVQGAKQQQQQQDGTRCDAAVPAVAEVAAAPGSGSEACVAADVQKLQSAPAVPLVARFGLRKGLKGGAGRHAFQPPFRR